MFNLLPRNLHAWINLQFHHADPSLHDGLIASYCSLFKLSNLPRRYARATIKLLYWEYIFHRLNYCIDSIYFYKQLLQLKWSYLINISSLTSILSLIFNCTLFGKECKRWWSFEICLWNIDDIFFCRFILCLIHFKLCLVCSTTMGLIFLQNFYVFELLICCN